ncbi:unnamed protein product, partial [Trichobilharzia regenti]
VFNVVGYSIEANQNVQRTHTIPDCHHDDVKKDKKCKYTDEEDYIRLYAKELPASSSSRVNKVNSEGFCLSENVEPPVSLSSPEAKPSLSNNIATNRQSHHNNHCTHHRHKHCKADEKVSLT